MQYEPPATLSPQQQSNIPEFYAWQWRLVNVTLTLTSSGGIAIDSFVQAGSSGISCSLLTFSVNRSAHISNQMLLPYHVNYMGWTGYVTGSLNLDSVASHVCVEELAIFSNGDITGPSGAGNDLGCTRSCLSNFNVVEIRATAANITGYIVLFPTFSPGADQIVPSCFCTLGSGTVVIPAASATPLIPDSETDVGKTTPPIQATIQFSDTFNEPGGVNVTLSSAVDSLLMQIDPWHNRNIPWGRMYPSFNALSQSQCDLHYSVPSGNVVLGSKAGKRATPMCATFLHIVMYIRGFS